MESWDLLSRYGFDKNFYDRLRAQESSFKLKKKFVIPAYHGKGFIVKRGQTFRIITTDGPQVADLLLYNAKYPKVKEVLRAMRTFLMEGAYIRPYTRLWSDAPWFRPMATCIEDTIEKHNKPSNGWFNHHILGTHCTSEEWEMFSGRKGLNSCHMNLLEAITPFGLAEDDIFENVNIWQMCSFDLMKGSSMLRTTPAKVRDYIEFYAEIDLLVAVSVCPDGDASVPLSEPDKCVVYPLGIEVYESGTSPIKFPPWHNWRPVWKARMKNET
jgi:uncharacterized protein YcgI (DUF1989 family)